MLLCLQTSKQTFNNSLVSCFRVSTLTNNKIQLKHFCRIKSDHCLHRHFLFDLRHFQTSEISSFPSFFSSSFFFFCCFPPRSCSLSVCLCLPALTDSQLVVWGGFLYLWNNIIILFPPLILNFNSINCGEAVTEDWSISVVANKHLTCGLRTNYFCSSWVCLSGCDFYSGWKEEVVLWQDAAQVVLIQTGKLSNVWITWYVGDDAKQRRTWKLKVLHFLFRQRRRRDTNMVRSV